MARTVPVAVEITDLPATKAAMEAAVTAAVEAERRRLLNLVRATCACHRCKDDVAALLRGD